MEIIGNYRIRYSGESMTVPVDDEGKLHLPDGKFLQLSDEQFAVVKQKISEKRSQESGAKPMTMPVEEETKREDETTSQTSVAPAQELSQRELAAQKREEKRISAQNKKAAAEAEKLARISAKEAARVERINAKAEQRARRQAAKDEAERLAAERRALKEKMREERRNSVSHAMKMTVIASSLATALITLIAVGAIFLWSMKTGLITINTNPPINGLVIDDATTIVTSQADEDIVGGDTQ